MSSFLGLTKKLIEENKSISVLRENLISSDILNASDKKVYDFVHEYYLSYNCLPSLETIEIETEIKFPKIPENTIQYWIDKVKKNYINKIVVELAAKVVNSKGDSDFRENSVKWIKEVYLKINKFEYTEKIKELKDCVDNVAIEHDKRQKKAGMYGIPFGIPYLDEVSDGAQPSDMIVLCARPGIGKTMLLLHMARTAHSEGKVPLVVTLEMSVFQNARRLLALDGSIPATKIRLGKLSHWGRKKLDDSINKIKQTETPFYFLEGSLSTTIEDLITRVQDIRPDVLYVDGAYMLRTLNKSVSRVERISHCAEILKSIAATYNIPVIVTYQFNRMVRSKKSGGLDNIGWSDTISQAASIALSLSDNDFGEERITFCAKQYKLLELIKGREGEKGSMRILFDMSRMLIKQEEVISGYINNNI